MMSFFQKPDPNKKLYKEARQRLMLGHKVINYRRDVLSAEDITEIKGCLEPLKDALKGGRKGMAPDAAKAAMEAAHPVLKKHGGDIYPLHFWNENIEMLLVAAIVAIAIRTFFFQPFKIPTNSMWPTYAGMTPTVYSVAEDESRPWLGGRLFNLAVNGAFNHRETAPLEGEIYLSFQLEQNNGMIAAKRHFDIVRGRTLGLIPNNQRRYYLYVDGAEGQARIPVDVPIDFDLDPVLLENFFPGQTNLMQLLLQGEATGQTRLIRRADDALEARLYTGITVEKGDPIIDFDINSGDMLFVDRFSYHFFRPKVGDPFVFRTDGIPGLRQNGQPNESYYIKRLVGEPGDELRVEGPALWRNGEPITGADAFELNRQQDGEYEGYVAAGELAHGTTDTVAEGHYYAMGDNSDQSLDSRLWPDVRTPEEVEQGTPYNQVPEHAVVGKAMFIFYPFTHRWGLAE